MHDASITYTVNFISLKSGFAFPSMITLFDLYYRHSNYTEKNECQRCYNSIGLHYVPHKIHLL